MRPNRKKILSAFGQAIGLSFIVAGCASGLASPADIESSQTRSVSKEDQADITVEHSPAEPPNWTQSASLSEVERCKIPDPRPRSEQVLYRGVRQGEVIGRDPVGFTEWRRPGLLPIEGEMNIIMAKIAFQDAPPSPSIPDGSLAIQAQKMTDLGRFWSQGEFNYKFQVVDGWVEIPANHADYPVSAGDDVDHSPEAYELARKNIEIVSQMVLENLPSDLDFSAADIFVPVWSHNMSAFTMPVTWRGGGLRSPNGEVTDIIFMGNSTYINQHLDNVWSIIAHDFLHLQGLNEHAPGPKFATHIGGQVTPARERGFSALIPAWETFLLGWFSDSQVHCIDSSELAGPEKIILTPLEVLGGERKTIVIATTEYKALVVESRRPVGYSETWPDEFSGLLVYEVDTDRDHLDHGENECSNSRENPKWAYYLLPDGTQEDEDCNNPAPYFVKRGMTLTNSGVAIELVHSSDEADYVKISPAAG